VFPDDVGVVVGGGAAVKTLLRVHCLLVDIRAIKRVALIEDP